MTNSHKPAIVLFAHGSRDPLWHKPMEAVASAIVQNDPSALVRCAYLELSTPDLPTVCAELAALGCTTVSVVPMFLGVGRHAREDLPVLVQDLRIAYPHMHFDLKAAVGENAALIQLLAQIAAQ